MNNNEKIVITGAGVVSAIGIGKEETFLSLRNGREGVAPIHYLQTSHQECMVGEVKLSNEELVQRLNIPAEKAMVRTSLLGILAMKEALDESRLSGEDLSKTAFVNGTTVGGMDMSEQFY